MNQHNRKISVIGLGYVGLPVAVAFAEHDTVIAFDIDHKRILELKSGVDKTNMCTPAMLQSKNLYFSSEAVDLAKADFHIVAVPTPVDQDNKPDLQALLSASEIIARILKKDDIVVYESTVYPGATENDCNAILEKQSGLKSGRDFFLGYSPERINPGDPKNTFKAIQKIVSAQDEKTLAIVAAVYSSVVSAGVYQAPSIKVAEAAKVVENTQRDLNIALINELAILFKNMDIDTHDVLKAAGTKWNFLAFKPGLVGGHCISVDPYYLAHQSQSLGYAPELILAARKMNDGMGEYIAHTLLEQFIKINKQPEHLLMTVLGITYKENVPDIKNTKAIDLIKTLVERGCTVQVCDPCADNLDVQTNYQIDLVQLDELKKADAVVLVVAHDEFISQGWQLIKKLLKPDHGIVYDVKAMLERDLTPENVTLIRL